MSIRFVYSALVRLHNDDAPELLAENCDVAVVDFDTSNDMGQFGQFFEEAVDILKAKEPPLQDGHAYSVLMAGKLCFGSYWTDCGMEYDSWIEVEWSHTRIQTEEAVDSSEFEFVV